MTAEQARKTREAALSSKKLVRIFERINNIAQAGGSSLYVSLEEMPIGGPALLQSEPYLYKIENKTTIHRDAGNHKKEYVSGYVVSWEG